MNEWSEDLPTRTEVDGVTTMWAEQPGPLQATLLVRVGSADESFSTSGTTHLLEHLALFGLGRPGDHTNGSVDQTVTAFHVAGEPETVVAHLATLTRQLVAPPLHRLEDELGVLRAEAAQRSWSFDDVLQQWRYGSRTYGLACSGGTGLPRVDGPALAEWSARYVTRGNSVLWLSGPPPAGLALYLPDGDRRPAPDPAAHQLGHRPALVDDDAALVALDAILPRSWANRALVAVLQERLVDELRTRRAVAYSPQVGYRPLTGTAGRLLAWSDLLREKQSDGVRPFVDVLEQLAVGQVTDAELERWREAALRVLDDPAQQYNRLASATWDVLFGRAPRDKATDRAQLEAVDGAAVTAVARAVLADALMVKPSTVAFHRNPWAPVPISTQPRLPGQAFTLAAGTGGGHRLVVGAEGLTLYSGEQHLSIAKATAVGVKAWPDGRRVVVSDEGNQITIEPNRYARGHELVALVDHLWGEELRIPMPARAASEVPAAPTGSQRAKAYARRAGAELGRIAWVRVLLVGLGITTVRAVIGDEPPQAFAWGGLSIVVGAATNWFVNRRETA